MGGGFEEVLCHQGMVADVDVLVEVDGWVVRGFCGLVMFVVV